MSMTPPRTPMTDKELGELLVLDSQPGPAKRIASARAADMVSAALDAWQVEIAQPAQKSLGVEPGGGPASATVAMPARLRPRRRYALILAAALCFTASAAVGGIYLMSREAEVTSEDKAANPPAATRAPEPEPEAETEAAPEAEAASETEAEAEAAPAPETAPATEPAPSRRQRPRLSESRNARDDREVMDLLKEANSQRGNRRWRAADAAYQKVLAQHPGTQAAYVAQIASAAIRLEHLGKARSALTLYQKALARYPGGALAEEARYGIAEAHRKLGNRAGELAALNAFLAHHPDSPLAGRARERLRALSQDAPERRRTP